MYWRHFDLSAEPFSLTPDPAFLYLSAVHAEAYAALTVGLRERRGLLAMIGEVGTGKTTLVYSLLSALGPEIHTAYISNARLSFDGILRSALRDFSVESDSVHVTDLLETFNEFLHSCAEEGTTAAVVIDEAQNLSRDTFEDLRLLTNFETYKNKLLQIVLVGQPELDSKLRDPSLRQVTDRIAVRCHVNPLTAHEVREYLQHRLSAAGGSIDIFSEPALRALISSSGGIPRSVNILGHNAMLFAYGAGRSKVTRRDVRDAVREREGRDLVRFEEPRARWFSGATRAPTRISYSRLLLAGATLGVVGFLLRGAIASFWSGSPVAGDTAVNAADVERRDGIAKPSADTVAGNGGARSASIRQPPTEAPRAAPIAARAPGPLSANDGAEAPAAVETRPSANEAVQPHRGLPALPAAQHLGSLPSAPTADAAGAGVAAPAPREQHADAEAADGTLAAASAPGVFAAGQRAVPRLIARGAIGERGSETIRVIQVTRGSSLSDLMTTIYGSYDPRFVPRIQAMNPQMKDPNYIVAGDELRFPEELQQEEPQETR